MSSFIIRWKLQNENLWLAVLSPASGHVCCFALTTRSDFQLMMSSNEHLHAHGSTTAIDEFNTN